MQSLKVMWCVGEMLSSDIGTGCMSEPYHSAGGKGELWTQIVLSLLATIQYKMLF